MARAARTSDTDTRTKSSAAKSSTGGTRSRTGNGGSRSKTSSAASHLTTDHDEIRHWVEARGGKPATVKRTGGKEDAGILRIDFQDRKRSLEDISWDEFFEKFDGNHLAFLYQEKLKTGEESRFFKFVHKED